MKNKTLFWFNVAIIFLINTTILAQTGPGGVGSSTSLASWLDANTLSQSTNNGDAVTTWTDLSGNGNNGTQASALSKPLFTTNSINGFPVLQFDGTDDFMDFTTNIVSNAITIFTVFARPSAGISTQLFLGNHLVHTQNRSTGTYYLSPTVKYSLSHPINTFSLFSLKTGAAQTGANLTIKSGLNSNTTVRNGVYNNPRSTIAARFANSVGHYHFFGGSIAEIITYDTELNDAQYNIVNNYLAGKYNLSTSPNYYSYDATYKNDILGIGREANGSQIISQGTDSLTISNASDLDNGEYLITGNNGNDFSASLDVPASLTRRWNRSWKVSKTGDVGTINLKFHIGTSSLTANPSNYALLVESVDGDFANGGTSFVAGGVFDGTKNTIEFQNITLPDDSYFTLAVTTGPITSTSSGFWNSTTTWDCLCIPDENQIVNVVSPHTVTQRDSAVALNLNINSGASLTLTNDTLNLSGDLTINGSFTTLDDGTLQLSGTETSQSMFNTSGSQVELNNVYINSNWPVLITSGGWSLSGTLRVSSGGLNVSSADSVVLLSTSTKTSQILESMTNAFTGDFIVQRYIPARLANYSNISSPIQSATVNDLEDDLILSGVGGRFGASVNGSGIAFRSVYAYDDANQDSISLRSLSDVLNPGQGYEVWLGTTLTNFSATTVDFVGTPNSGSLVGVNAQVLYRNWNLMGNPFHAFISYDLIPKQFAPDSYYIFDANIGNYQFYSGGSKPLIAPSQGFWVYKTTGGGHLFGFGENVKVSNSSPAFVRKKQIDKVTISISSSDTPFKNQTYIEFNSGATSEIDNLDAPFLVSPLIESPGIYSKPTNDDLKLTNNAISMNESSHKIPLNINIGIAANYQLKINNLEELNKYYNCSYISDIETGKLIDIQVENDYSFHSEKGKFNRFNLILSNSYEDCERLINSPKTSIQDVNSVFNLRNFYNDWYLDYTVGEEITQVQVQIFNLAGQQVKNPTSISLVNSGSIKIPNLNELSGLFIIQITSNKNVVNKTIKL